MKCSNKRVSVKNLVYHVFHKLGIHPELKTESDIPSKIIMDKIKKKYGKIIMQKVPRRCILTIVEELLDENDND